MPMDGQRQLVYKTLVINLLKPSKLKNHPYFLIIFLSLFVPAQVSRRFLELYSLISQILRPFLRNPGVHLQKSAGNKRRYEGS
jgi:hypothetical protein